MSGEKVQYNKLTDDANEILNKAIEISSDCNCDTISSVHFLLAFLLDDKNGILKESNKSYNDIYNAYKKLADKGEYNISTLADLSDPSKATMGTEIMYRRSIGEDLDDRAPSDEDINANPLLRITNEMVNLIESIAQGEDQNIGFLTIFVVKKVSSDELLEAMLTELDSPQLDRFLDTAKLSIKDLQKCYKTAFSIPNSIEKYIEDMNVTVANKKDTICNVDEYVDEMFEILSRKLKSNPCLVGPAGVGKTTIVNRLVQRIISNTKVPYDLRNYHVIYINSTLLTADTMYRGQFEERMKNLLEWAADKHVILFLDEFHTFIHAGAHGDDADSAGNMIKKYLSDGDIKIIGATTTEEYHKYIEKDSAFDRRLQRLEIKEPDEKTTLKIIKNSIADYEKYHSVIVDDSAIDLAVKLSGKYIKNKYFPDKAYTVIDQACARVKISDSMKVVDDDIINVVGKITGINVDKLNKNQKKQILNLEKVIGKNLIGQEQAVSIVCNAIRRSKSGIQDPNKPLASFLFVGPTGVGKTELCKVLSKEIGLSKESFIKVDMSEFKEEYSISKLIGSAPGYIGYGEGGHFTEKVKHNPYSLVLFDEIEKAHPSIFNTFLQLLDEGRLTDAEGTTIDFTNCIIVMTSNAGYGADGMKKGSFGFGGDTSSKDPHEREKIAIEALESTFRPEFLNRLDNIVIFDKLTKEQTRDIVKLQLDHLANRVKEQNINIKFSKSMVDTIVDRGYSDKYGARNIKREIQDTIEDKLSKYMLANEVVDGENITVGWRNNTISITKR